MGTNDKDQVTQDGMVELDEDELGAIEGGWKMREISGSPSTATESKWKVSEMDGMSANVLSDEADTKGWKVTVDNIAIGNVRK